MVNYISPVVEGKLLVLAAGGVLGRKHDKSETAWPLIKLSIFPDLFLGICNRDNMKYGKE